MTKDTGGLLLSAEPPWVVRADLESTTVAASLTAAGNVGIVVELDGSATTTSETLFAAFAHILKFPDYFGANWPALKDCLTDLDWLPADSYVVVVRNSDQLLAAEPIERSSLLKAMVSTGEEWAAAVELGEWWDRPPRPFHLVLDQGVVVWPRVLLDQIGELGT